MKSNKNIYFLYLLISLFAASCIDDPEANGDLQNAELPKIGIHIYPPTDKSLKIEGEVNSENGSPVIERGIEWRLLTPDSSATYTKVASGEGKGVFSLTLDIQIDTVYQIRAYAINGVGTAYSETQRIETTVGKASIETLTPDSIHAEWALCGGRIIIPGEAKPSEWGIYFSSHPDLVEKDSLPFDKPIAADSTFKAVVIKLTPKTVYYVRSYCKDIFGRISLGEIKSFQTTAGTPDVGNLKIVSNGYYEATVSAEVLKENDAHVTTRGFLWSTQKQPLKDEHGELAGDTIIVGEGAGSYYGTIKNLDPNTLYYLRAFARNSYGITYSDSLELKTSDNKPSLLTVEVTNLLSGTAKASGKLMSAGASAVTSVGFCWGTQAEPTLTSGHRIEVTLGEDNLFSGTITGLAGSKKYYIRAYATNAEATSYGKDIIITTPSIFETLASSSFPGDKLLLGSAYVSADSKGYLLGGDLGSTLTNRLWMFDSKTVAWQEYKPFPNGGRKWQAIADDSNTLTVFGGIDNTNKVTNELYSFDPSMNEWKSLSSGTTPPRPTHMATAGYIDNAFYIVGGKRDSIVPVTKEVWKYTSGSWAQMADFPQAQYQGINLVINGNIYAGLGLNSADKPNYTLWRATSSLSSWVEESTSYPGRKAVTGVALNEQIYVVDVDDDVWMYDISTKTWTQKTRLTISGVQCMFTLNNIIYIGFGENKTTLIKYNALWDINDGF